jgi:hypothetical protein
MPQLRKGETSTDLAVAVAVVSSYLGAGVPRDIIWLGEVGLGERRLGARAAGEATSPPLRRIWVCPQPRAAGAAAWSQRLRAVEPRRAALLGGRALAWPAPPLAAAGGGLRAAPRTRTRTRTRTPAIAPRRPRPQLGPAPPRATPPPLLQAASCAQ